MESIIVVNDLEKTRIIKEMSKENTLVKCKVMGIQEFIRKFYFDYDEKTCVYIMEKYQTTKEIAQIYLKNLYYLKDTEEPFGKIEFLMCLYQDLIKQNLLIKNELWIELLKLKKVVFYHITKQDSFFKKLKQDVEKITTVEIQNHLMEENQEITLEEYETIEQEVIGIISKICQFLKNGFSPSHIFISNLNEEYRSLFLHFSEIFHIPFQLKEEESYLSNEIVQIFIKSNETIDSTILDLKEKYSSKEELEIIKHLIDICNRYSFIKEEKKKKELIIENLKKSKKKLIQKKNSIQEISFLEQEINKDSHLFVMGVKEGNFPSLKKDEQYLNDLELNALGLETTKEQNELEKKCYQMKLKTFSHITLSYPKQDGKLITTPSSILSDIGVTIAPQEPWNHSHLYNQLMLSSKIDYFKKYGVKDSSFDILKTTYQTLGYSTYRNDFQPFPIKEIPKKLSYTAIDAFFHCSFRYYLTYILKLKKEKNEFDLKLGNLFHAILKESYEEGFNFENSFKNHLKEMESYSPKEIFFLNKLKKDLKRVIDTLEKQEREKDFKILTEEKLALPMEDITLEGIVDKIFIKKEENQTLVSIVDYKTGNPNISLDNLNYGFHLQLPIYLILIKKLPFSNIKIIGFYLQKILPSIPLSDKIHTEEELREKKLMLQGYSIDEESVLKIFDPTYENSKLIQGLKVSSKGFYPYSKIVKEKELRKIENIVLEKLKEAIKQIKEGNFVINPKRVGNDLIGCEYCPYQEICYRKEENIANVKEVKQKEILGSESYEIVDERSK